jgi:hypothetical protein
MLIVPMDISALILMELRNYVRDAPHVMCMDLETKLGVLMPHIVRVRMNIVRAMARM